VEMQNGGAVRYRMTWSMVWILEGGWKCIGTSRTLNYTICLSTVWRIESQLHWNLVCVVNNGSSF